MSRASLDRAAALIRSFPAQNDLEVTHELYFARESDAASAEADAARLGCSVRVHAHARGGWGLVVTYSAAAGPGTVAPITQVLRALAKRHAGEYGGWDCSWQKRST